MNAGLFLVSGPPGAGKTSVLHVLGEDFTLVAEPARRVLAEQRATGGRGTGEQDADLFVSLMLETAVNDLATFKHVDAPILFDRGLPDLLAFARYYGRDETDISDALQQADYARQVFWFPPWEAIYTTDDERKMSFTEAAAFGELIRAAYLGSGFELVEVPKLPIAERSSYIESRLSQFPPLV